MKDSRNWYAYCRNYATVATDPYGTTIYVLEAHLGAIATGFSGTGGISIGYDDETGHVGLIGMGGIGLGAGVSGGPGIGIGFDQAGQINGNGAGGYGVGDTGYAAGGALPILAAEATFDENFANTGGSVGIGAGTEHGVGIGVFESFEVPGLLTLHNS